ncbi:breast cancer suppressor candidate 1,bcsc-1 [Tritrichomonas foetus]|uniref:Breast cancer suppressor candidate 1,bcsc-1 n=1 Tax=Tritrichomonas foetus TaxID=1144522 RepID=A0A1J4KA64_9EUKA|nr:breast cancer suppressor candidate 1,bcsc-1 [Tritrichomonas foetus]|eukprot:OHT07858.1 breast cancer suppressor candidate 1,bcsc-1 [Tritrichomonas foetus]
MSSHFFIINPNLSIGSFYYTHNNQFVTLQPKNLVIKGMMRGFLLDVEINQTTSAPCDIPEVSYTFPTDGRLCVHSLYFSIGDEKIQAKIKSSDQAEEIFEEAVSDGITAVMTRTLEPGLLSVAVGNVPKDKEITVSMKISFLAILSNSKTLITKIPLKSVTPDGTILDLVKIPSLKISIDLDIKTTESIANVCLNCDHTFDKSIQNCSTKCYGGKLTSLNKLITDENLIVEIELEKNVESQILSTEKASLLSIIPVFSKKTQKTKPNEYVILLDCSCSMKGASIENAKKALTTLIQTFPNETSISIYCFGTTYFPICIRYILNHKNKSNIKTKIKNIKANLGGTQMSQILKFLFLTKPSSTRQVFLISDGEAYDRQEAITLISENKHCNRFFSIGLGNGADAGFLDEVAQITNGKSDYVYNSTQLESLLIEDYILSTEGSITNYNIIAENTSSFQTVPFPLPPLLPKVVKHIFIKSDQNMSTILVNEHDSSFEYIISDNRILANESTENITILKDALYALFAQEYLKEITTDKEKSISVSLESGVLCKYTSYVGVSKKKYVDLSQQNSASRECAYISIEPPKISHVRKKTSSCFEEKCCRRYSSSRSHQPDCAAPVRSYCRAPPPPDFTAPVRSYYRAPPPPCDSPSSYCRAPPPPCDSPSSYCRAPPPPLPCGATLTQFTSPLNDPKIEIVWNSKISTEDILRQQSFDGFWEISKEIISKYFTERIMNEISGKFSEISPIVLKRILATIFALAYLEKHRLNQQKMWKSSHNKAVKWLNRMAKQPISWNEFISAILGEMK